RIFRAVWIDPIVQRCCWALNESMSAGSSAGTTTRGTNANSQPWSCARYDRSRSSVSVSDCHPPAGAVARGALDDEVAVEKNRLAARQDRVVAIEVPPARLRHADARIGEAGDEVEQEGSLRQEIGVEHRHQLPARLGKPRRQGPGLESLPGRTPDVPDIAPLAAHL